MKTSLGATLTAVAFGLMMASVATPADAGEKPLKSTLDAPRIGQQPVHIFTLPGCTYCEQAKTYMTQHHIQFVVHDLMTEEAQKLAESWQIPLMAPAFAYKNRVLRGYTAEKLAHFIEE